MKPWVELYAAHRDARRLESGKWDREFRSRLIKLANAGFCERSVQGRFSYGKNARKRGLLEWSISEPAELTGVPHLTVATLSLMALTDRDGGHLHMFTVTIEGERLDGTRWTLAVHLPDDRETDKNPDGDRQGRGACGHAALHCHVGPDLKTGPEVRVPMPNVNAADAFDWVLSQIVPTAEFEPAGWADVQEELKKSQ
ncbi:MAG: hypothetical protein AB7S68_26155 [Polyangiaceae bacterium]